MRVIVVPRGSVAHLVPEEGSPPICGRYAEERVPDMDEVDDDDIPVCADCERRSIHG